MKTLLGYLMVFFFRFVLWFRYRITVKGLEKLTPEALNKPGGVLFLPNHPAMFIDPTAVTLALWPKFKLRPLVIEYMYNTPIVNQLMKYLNAVAVPNYEATSNTLKRKQNEEVMNTVTQGLKEGDNFLIYPAGQLKSQEREVIGGSSGAHQIVRDCPEANVVLVRVKGLWGSSFSRALIGKSPPLFETILNGLKIALKNLIFFTPRRDVIVEFELPPEDFPKDETRINFNKWLEKWYNQPDGLSPQVGKDPGDSLIFVSYCFWKDVLPKKYVQPKADDNNISSEIPSNIEQDVMKKVAELSGFSIANIRKEMSLANDLGLDSLDLSELATHIQTTFKLDPVPASELTTVKKTMGIAAKQVEFKPKESEGEIADLSKWKADISKFRVQIAHGSTIPEVFLNNCDRMGKSLACADSTSGILSYPRLKLAVLLLAEYIRHLPGKHIGIMLPSSVAAYLCILATQLAGKVPLMINWTIGRRHIESVVELTNVEAVLSSWKFLDRLEGVELDGIEDKLIMMESVKEGFSLKDKIRAFIRSKRSVHSILRLFDVLDTDPDSAAALLFTSGTESTPKGVPLSHRNLLSNQKSSLEGIEIFSDDVLFGVLPPFHSFGFNVSGILSLLAGIRIAFSPDPTDGPRMAKGFETWGATLMCGAPTFLLKLLKSAKPEQIKTMRLCLSGAEKAPPELFDRLAKIDKEQCLIEGYGITECSPIISFNRVGKPRKGVGPAAPGTELLIVNAETQEPLPVGKEGMILVHGPGVFSGYLNPGLESPFVTIDGKQWYRSGDLGILDEEGNLTISGRLKRFVKVGGEMISLLAIEESLLRLTERKGWPMPEEGPPLAISGKENDEGVEIVLFSTFDVEPEDVNKALRESGFTNLVRISKVFKVDLIPIMGTGKTNYRLLEDQYWKK
ncbi:MAG: AMP-binding protein [Waddliaceae bacterium]